MNKNIKTLSLLSFALLLSSCGEVELTLYKDKENYLDYIHDQWENIGVLEGQEKMRDYFSLMGVEYLEDDNSTYCDIRMTGSECGAHMEDKIKYEYKYFSNYSSTLAPDIVNYSYTFDSYGTIYMNAVEGNIYTECTEYQYDNDQGEIYEWEDNFRHWYFVDPEDTECETQYYIYSDGYDVDVAYKYIDMAANSSAVKLAGCFKNFYSDLDDIDYYDNHGYFLHGERDSGQLYSAKSYCSDKEGDLYFEYSFNYDNYVIKSNDFTQKCILNGEFYIKCLIIDNVMVGTTCFVKYDAEYYSKVEGEYKFTELETCEYKDETYIQEGFSGYRSLPADWKTHLVEDDD